MSDISRRDLLGGAAKLSVAGGALALSSGTILSACTNDVEAHDAEQVSFHGTHQAGIVTPVQEHLVYAAFDVHVSRRTELAALLRRWSDAIALMTAGHATGPMEPANPKAVPTDTGEAAGLSAARLTVTIGFGRSLFFDDEGEGRFGIADHLPHALVELPHFAGDALDAARSNGDLSVQCCADDAQTAFHAFHNLATLAHGTARVRWVQLGFGRAAATGAVQSTPRNLMGFKDGTNNIRADETDALRDHVWVASTDEPAWMRDGTYVVARRIKIHIEEWDRTGIGEQQEVIGRTKLEGAPLSGKREHDPPQLEFLPANAHIRIAAPAENGGIRILRRGYNFADGADEHSGKLDAGLFFVAYQRDPRTHFIPLQQQLASNDALNEYIQHVGSAVFAVPPGVREGGFVGETLLG
jgi:deferrochelatase/peroxidase EfeB